MAATRIMALHINRGRTVAQCLKKSTDYTENAKKTNDGQYISSYGCDARTADEEFLLSRREYEANYRSLRKDDVIAYQIRQAFKPGEITPEKANEIGYELAMRFTKGKHAFTVCTHVDKRHIHNHIIFNSVTLDGRRKFRDFRRSGMAVRKISDILCMENGLSVIKPTKGEHYKLQNLIDIEKAMQSGKGIGYERWAKVFNVKQMSKSLLFLQERHISNYDELVLKMKTMEENMTSLSERISALEQALSDNKELQTHIINFAKSKGTDKEAKAAFAKFERGKLPKMADLRSEHERLWQEKKQAYVELSEAKKEIKEYLIAKKNLELMLGISEKEEKAKNENREKSEFEKSRGSQSQTVL